jgi:hypothetical protein
VKPVTRQVGDANVVSDALRRIEGMARNWARRNGHVENADRPAESSVLARLGLTRESVQRAVNHGRLQRAHYAATQRENAPMPAPAGPGKYSIPATALPESAEIARRYAAVAEGRPGIQWRRIAKWLRIAADDIDAGREVTRLYVYAASIGVAPSAVYTAWRELRGYKFEEVAS